MVTQAFIKLMLGAMWAITPEKFALIKTVMARHVHGDTLPMEEIRAVAELAAARRAAKPSSTGETSVIGVYGTLIPRGNFIEESSGAMSAESIGAQLQAALADTNVTRIVLDVDSPGGSVNGIAELAAQIRAATKSKPVVAIANHLAASAAYWLASAASELWVTPSGEVGSIGVFCAHEDVSQMLAAMGVKETLIAAGQYKTEGNPFEPLTEEARAAMQARVDDYYAMFVRDVARFRGVSAATVREGFGQGRVVGASAALAQGMVDKVGTLEELLKTKSQTSKPTPSPHPSLPPSGKAPIGEGKNPQGEMDFRQRRARSHRD